MKNPIRHHDALIKQLKNRDEAVAYLNVVAEEGHIPFLLKAIRNVVEAQGGIGELAKKTGLARTTLYKTISANGNPEVNTLASILHVYGIRFAFVTEQGHRDAA